MQFLVFIVESFPCASMVSASCLSVFHLSTVGARSCSASGLFARKGYRETTTREIAERAGINEDLLSRHFPSKKKLYWTLIEELCSARGRRHNVARIVDACGRV
jgi:hypothetical protein